MTYHNEDTLPDLRVTIAESMEALASAQTMAMPLDRETAMEEIRRYARAIDGAETLRWCAEREAPSYEEMKANLVAAEDARESAEILSGELVDNIKYAVSKWEHTDECLDTGFDDEKDCPCALVLRRQSVLNAVA